MKKKKLPIPIKKTKLPKEVIKESEEIISELSDKHKAFCREYCMDLNGTKAYMRVYPDCSYDAASVCALRLLRNDKIKQHIKHLQDNLEELTGITKAKVLNELHKIAFSNISDLHNTWIERKKFEELTMEQKACIQVIDSFVDVKNIGGNSKANQKFIEVEMVKIKCYSKTEAIKIINEMQGFNKPVESNIRLIDERKKISDLFPTDEEIINAAKH